MEYLIDSSPKLIKYSTMKVIKIIQVAFTIKNGIMAIWAGNEGRER